MKKVDKLSRIGIRDGTLSGARINDAGEQTLEEIVDEFIDSNPIIYERLSKL